MSALFPVPSPLFPRTVGALPYGLSPGVGAPGPLSNLNIPGLPTPYQLYVNGRDTELHTNGRINFSRRCVPMDKSATLRNLKDIIDSGSYHWEHVPERMPLYSVQAPINIQQAEAPAVMACLPALNLELMSEVGRREYGGDSDASRLDKDWTPGGVVQTYDFLDHANRGEMKVAVTYEKRTRMPNFWAVGGKPVLTGDWLWWVYRRRTLGDEESNTKFQKTPEEREAEYKLEQQEKEKEKMFSAYRHPASMSEKGEVPNTYWQILPLAMPPKQAPPTATYMSAKEGWIGTAKYCGVVSDVFSNGPNYAEMRIAAKDACFPERQDPDKFRTARKKLPDLEVMLCVKS